MVSPRLERNIGTGLNDMGLCSPAGHRAPAEPSSRIPRSATCWACSPANSLLTFPSERHGGDAVVLSRPGAGPHRHEPVRGVVRRAGPDLLSVDDPSAVDTSCPGLDVCGVGSGIRFAEERAPPDITEKRRPDV